MSILTSAWSRFWGLRWFVKWPLVALAVILVLPLLFPAPPRPLKDARPVAATVTTTATASATAARTNTPSATATASPTAIARPAFFGTKYAASVADRIDALAAARDCSGLQAEFDTASRNDAATRTRTGSGTADLMQYIQDKMRAAACGGTSSATVTATAAALITATPTAATVAPSASPFYANCTEARRAGVTPIRRGQPGYRAALDGDNDGVACE